MLTKGVLINDRYLIVQQVGQGGMGAVYEATDQRLRCSVALKQMTVSAEQYGHAFEREAQLLANLRHSALPKVIDYFISDEGSFLVMEFIDGADLFAMRTQYRATFSVGEVLHWADSLLDALDYLHTRNPPIIHRDIKPQNLKLTPRREIILLDFGLAKGSIALQSQATKSVSGWTPQYAPLEQINGAGTGPRSDLYALAATLFHLLAGQPPVNATARAAEVLAGRPDPIRSIFELNAQVPKTISDVIMRSLSLDPANRFSTAAEMRAALQQSFRPAFNPATSPSPQVVAGMKTVVEPPAPDTMKTRRMDEPAVVHHPFPVAPAPAVIKRRRSGLWLGALAILILIVAAGGVGIFMLGHQTERSKNQAGVTPPSDASGDQPGSTAGHPASTDSPATGAGNSNEVLVGDLVFKVLSAQLTPYAGSKNLLKLNVRVTWNGQYDLPFNGDLFRLLVDGSVLEPTEAPSEIIEAYSAREAALTFQAPSGMSKAEVRVGNPHHEPVETEVIPLDLKALIDAGKNDQTAAANQPPRQYPIVIPGGQRAAVGKTAYKILGIRIDQPGQGKMAVQFDMEVTNNGEYMINFWSRSFRLLQDGVPTAPAAEAPNLTVDGGKSKQARFIFIIPETADKLELKVGQIGQATETIPINWRAKR